MLVYVLNIEGQPLMPTSRKGKVRRLLKNNKAKVVMRCPFTVQLLYECSDVTQDITLGVDAGSKTIGLSATTANKVLFEAEVELRNDISKKLSTRREIRQSRRSRKRRYRKPRFLNRVGSKKKGWLAPSVKQKRDSHIEMVRKVHKILPITKIVVETASFDIQKIKNPDINGKEYQEGEQLGFWNIREYVLFRDGHTCQYCKGKSKDDILNVHHIESRQTGGDAPNNLVTLCETCHIKYHKGLIKLPDEIKRGKSYRDAAFMGIMRWEFYERLKTMYKDVSLTFGYITKNTRIRNGLPKAHYIDARCISGNPTSILDGTYYQYRKVRNHNRQLHKVNTLKGGIRKRNQAPHVVKGFRLFDRVKYHNAEYFIFGRRTSGSFDIRDLKGNKVNKGSISYQKLQLIERSKSYLIERRKVAHPTT